MNWRRSVFVLAALLLCPTCSLAEGQAEEHWIQLFNGRDLTGWTPKIVGHKAGDNFADTFRVEDGLLEVRYDKYDGDFQGRFGHLFYNHPFSHYKIRAEYRFVGEQAPGAPSWALRNNGIMIHGQTAESMGLDQSFPVSMEFQLLGGDGQHERPNGSLCMPGTQAMRNGKLLTAHCTNSTSKTFHGDQWVTAEVEVHGGRLIRHIINGEEVFEYNEPRLDEKDPDAKRLLEAGAEKMLNSGTISLQSESAPCDFRKVELMELDD